MEKIENMNLDMNSTTPLEHTFGRARIKVHDIHIIQKFIRVIGFMNTKSLLRKIEEINKIKGRTSSFSVTIEDRDKDECFFFFFSSTPQQISMEFIILIFNEDFDNDFSNLYSFIEFIRDFDEFKKPNTLTINTATLGTQQTKTIKQRMAFKISTNQNEFIEFLQHELPEKKLTNNKLSIFIKYSLRTSHYFQIWMPKRKQKLI